MCDTYSTREKCAAEITDVPIRRRFRPSRKAVRSLWVSLLKNPYALRRLRLRPMLDRLILVKAKNIRKDWLPTLDDFRNWLIREAA